MDKKILEFLDSHLENGVLCVMKGFEVADYGVKPVSLAQTIENKMGRLMALTKQPRQIIAYDEFVCLRDFLLLQYRKIYIIENPVFHLYYPLNVRIDENVHTALLRHFADKDADEEEPSDELTEYANVYGNYLETSRGTACCYNLDETQLRHEKIERISFPVPPVPLEEKDSPDAQTVNICDDTDYYELAEGLRVTEESFAVIWDNYVLGKEVMRRLLERLNALYPNRLTASPTRAAPLRERYPEAEQLLKRYWGEGSAFRTFQVYDLDAVERHEKAIIPVSQEEVISDLIEQAEHCINREAFRDVFVTAPTGSGKSLLFQLPAIYLAEKYELVTLVITPLIGLMNDQVKNLAEHGYSAVRTINSDISPVLREEILEDVREKRVHILYLSPESLLSRSDVEQLIGARRIGMIVVDEAHIVTTWGKQFRPDYWFLGDHVRKIRTAQQKKEIDPSAFIIATFTATAIYEGREDMYHETLNSLHMVDPITYLGYIRRSNITIDVSEVDVKRNKTEYEINKFDSLIELIRDSLRHSRKTLIYFPTVALVRRFYEYCYSQNLSNYVTMYHGQLHGDEKEENFRAFRDGGKLIMSATKAFGMGIDIPDIAVVAHFAPTGNVCDYVQEIGRAARQADIQGLAVYRHMANDFQHINRLHGMSAIFPYQLVEVIKKILELYTSMRYGSGKSNARRPNQMLIDAESFAYIFENDYSSDDDLINKVKTAMLLIQKDYENRGYPPFHMRPIPMFRYGYFAIPPRQQETLNRAYPDAAKLVFHDLNVCQVDLQLIWEKDYARDMSFPKFKFLLYTNSRELALNTKWNLTSALCVDIFLEVRGESDFQKILQAFRAAVNASVSDGTYKSRDFLVEYLRKDAKISQYRAQNIVNVMLAAMDIFQKEGYGKRMSGRLYQVRASGMRNPEVTKALSYQFSASARDFFRWIESRRQYILDNLHAKPGEDAAQKLYVVNGKGNACKEITTILGVLESMGYLRFRSLGGSGSQIYIYVNQTKTMQMVRDNPKGYRNRLLELINSRHQESKRMMTYLFQNHLTSDEIWNHLENYFLGILPEALQEPETPDPVDETVPLQFEVGGALKKDYDTWEEVEALFNGRDFSDYAARGIPIADYFDSRIILSSQETGENREIHLELCWESKKVAVTSGDEDNALRQSATRQGWTCVPVTEANATRMAELVG